MKKEINTLEDFIGTLSEEQQEFFLQIHSFLLDIFPFRLKMRYKVPFYDDKIWICYLNPRKENGFELCFVDGMELSNTQNLLESRGRKRITGIILKKNENIPEQKIIEIIHEALLLDKNRIKKINNLKV